MKLKDTVVYLLLTVLACWSCQKENWRDKSPETLIIGKWELVRDSTILNWLTEETEINEYIPGGYVEFLPEGQLAWYDYQTKLYTLFEGKYVVENLWYAGWFWLVPDDSWYLQHTNHDVYWRQKIEIGNPVDLPACSNNKISFEDENTMILLHYSVKLYFIYKRIK